MELLPKRSLEPATSDHIDSGAYGAYLGTCLGVNQTLPKRAKIKRTKSTVPSTPAGPDPQDLE